MTIPSDDWLLIIDASLNRRIAPLLRNQRLRMALSCEDLRVAGFEDRPLLRFLHMYWPSTVLVTADDHMPEEHGDLIDRWNQTIAVIDPGYPATYRGGDAWHWEIVHRWVHNMQRQPRGTIYRYNARGRRIWTKPRRLKRVEPTAPAPTPPGLPPDKQNTGGEGDYGEQLRFGEAE